MVTPGWELLVQTSRIGMRIPRSSGSTVSFCGGFRASKGEFFRFGSTCGLHRTKSGTQICTLVLSRVTIAKFDLWTRLNNGCCETL